MQEITAGVAAVTVTDTADQSKRDHRTMLAAATSLLFMVKINFYHIQIFQEAVLQE